MSTPTSPPTKKAPRQSDVERERRQFHALLASNPNYFGTLPELDLPVQLAKQGDTSYERLTCAALSPERDRLEATVEIRRGSGYRGGLCGQGSFEHVRFFLSYDGGASWVDEGLASINVHDLTGGRTCKGDTWPPLTYVCGVDVDPRRSWCRRPVLPLLRQPEVAWFFASVFFTVLAHTSLYAFFSLYLVSLGYGKTTVGALWAVSVAVEIAFFWYQGRWFARLSAHGWLQVVALVTAARFVATAAGGASMGVLVVAQMSHAVTFATHHATCIALLQRYFPGRLQGRGQALYTTLGYGLPGVVGGLGGGWIVQQLGFATVFWAAALAGLVRQLAQRFGL